MILKIDPTDFEHVPKLSRYNLNLYKSKENIYNGNNYFYILEKCDELYQTLTLFESNDVAEEIRLLGEVIDYGTHLNDMSESKELLIDFGIYYT